MSASDWFSLGARVVVEDLSPELVAVLKNFWEDTCALPDDGRTLTLRVGALLPVPADAQAETLPLMEQTVSLWRAGNELWVPQLLHLKVQPGGALFTLAPEASSQQEWPPALLEAWTLFFTEAHRAGGWLPLHAAVISHQGRAVAVSGVSGAGKSTATLRLSADYAVLAEDRAFWQASSGRVAGLDRCLRLFPESVERFAPHLQALAERAPRDAKGKYMLPLSALTGPSQLAALLCFAPPGSAPLALSAAERVRAVWEMTGFPLTALAREEVQRGIGRLLPLLAQEPITRETAIERVKALLGN